MNLEQAIQLVLNEAETSALGECSSEGNRTLEAVELVQAFYDEHGHHFSNFSVDNAEETCHS
jgi:hypothetical protein